jgi:Uma2 family endonuclease
MATAVLEPKAARTKPAIELDEYGDPILPKGAELVDGKILEKPMSELSNWVGGQVMVELHRFVAATRVGIVFTGTSDQGYQCFPSKPGQIRKPDVSFLRRDMSKFFLRDHGYTPEVPDLIVEVLSPGDTVADLDGRLRDFRSAGTKLMWVIDPMERSAKVIHPDGIAYPLEEDGILDGEDVLPGFKLPLAAILPPKA